MNTWIIFLVALIVSIALAVAFVVFSAMKGRNGIDRRGRPLRYELTKRAKRLRKIGMTATITLLVVTVVASTVLASGGLSNFMGMFARAAENEDPSTASGDVGQADTGNTGDADVYEVGIDEVVHPGLNMSQEELDVLTAGLEFYVGRQSMTSWLPIRSELCGFQNAVSIPLNLMFLDYWYVEELHGRSRTNPDVQALPTADVLKAISEKLEEWEKEYADLPEEEKNQAMKQAIKQEIASNVIFADMVLQFFCSQKYYTENNQWLLEGRDMLDQAYAEPNGLWSLCEYEEGYDEDSDCASAHIVYRNDIMVRTVNSQKETGEDKSQTATNDGDNAVNSNTDNQDETEYYSFGYVTLTQQLIALIDETTTVGICKGMTTTENWWLTEQANPAFTRTELSPEQESEDVFLLQVVDKNGRIILSFGFNMKDRRIGLYDRTDKPVVARTPNLTVRHLEEGTNNKIADSKTEYRAPGTSLDDVGPVSAGDYVCINPDEAKGKVMPDGNLVITFYYRKAPGETSEPTPEPSPEPSPDPTNPPSDGNGSKDTSADPENKPENDHGIGDNDDPGVGSGQVNSSDEAGRDTNYSEENAKREQEDAKTKAEADAEAANKAQEVTDAANDAEEAAKQQGQQGGINVEGSTTPPQDTDHSGSKPITGSTTETTTDQSGNTTDVTVEKEVTDNEEVPGGDNDTGDADGDGWFDTPM